MTMTEAVFGARQKHEEELGWGRGSQGTLNSDSGWDPISIAATFQADVSRRPQVSIHQPWSGLDPTLSKCITAV